MANINKRTNFIVHLLAIRELFDNDSRLSSSHVSLYYALFFEWNDNRFRNPFPIFRNEIMTAAKIGSANTYIKVLKELEAFGYIKYNPSFNPKKSSEVTLIIFDNGSSKGHDKSTVKGSDNGGDKSLVMKVRPFNKELKDIKPLKDIKHCKDGMRFVSDNGVDSIVNLSLKSKKKNFTFSIPSCDEVKSFFLEKNKSDLDAEKFFNHFESNGWLVGGKTKMKNWQAAARNWIARSEEFSRVNPSSLKGADNLNVNQNKDYSVPL